MNKTISILMVGAGGYGNYYVDALLDNEYTKDITIAGVVDPNPLACRNLDILKKMNVPFFTSIEEFYSQYEADLAIISTPIQFHKSQVCYALSKGSNVLCEKPVCATIQDALAMLKAQKETDKLVSIGFQWSYNEAIQKLKKDIMGGVFGKPLRFKTIVLWPRNEDYYNRGWAAKIKDNSGNWILDSIANNAAAHYLHNMLFLLGDSMDTSEYPKKITAELYRANHIENFDTVCAKIITKKGVELCFYASHATLEHLDPTFQYEFENACITFHTGTDIQVRFKDGSIKNYGNPDEAAYTKLYNTLDTVRGITKSPCNIKTSLPHIICINGMQESKRNILDFPVNLVKYDSATRTVYTEGLNDILKDCYDNWTFPAQIKIPWAESGKEINLEDYTYFNDDIS
ncbi:Gfo/Idh/MocA family protein [Anaerocolumna sp. MB42-C2]|uniref:Gfo/Idh/MocA family protein n=1 Tax=Anaerocolumna sp. MB42-C2 TaxID=3070997 RepID=UPI0027DFE2DC|nr:Gfo/Idh/MocA family oxidoreductase [Anaerocolumna sp. MB42-C2]WMJ86872.1 Gfo/Idh/MocA family oxidoreductase [Anaerocolumna sp. MB42-C2]